MEDFKDKYITYKLSVCLSLSLSLYLMLSNWLNTIHFIQNTFYVNIHTYIWIYVFFYDFYFGIFYYSYILLYCCGILMINYWQVGIVTTLLSCIYIFTHAHCFPEMSHYFSLFMRDCLYGGLRRCSLHVYDVCVYLSFRQRQHGGLSGGWCQGGRSLQSGMYHKWRGRWTRISQGEIQQRRSNHTCPSLFPGTALP